jgi:flagellar assembly protein FliH
MWTDRAAGGVAPLVLPEVDQLEPVRPVTLDPPVSSPAMDAEHDAGYVSGWAEGLAAGAEEGRRAGYEDGLAIAERQVVDRVAHALDALEAARRDLEARDAVTIDELAAGIGPTVVAIVEAVLQHEVGDGAEAVVQAIHRGLALAPDRGDAVVRLHPDDAEALRDSSTSLVDLAPGRTLELAPDPAISAGGVVLVIGACTIDAQLASAITRVREVLGA